MLFHNMALCYQKMQCLEECSSCIEQALDYLPSDEFNVKETFAGNKFEDDMKDRFDMLIKYLDM